MRRHATWVLPPGPCDDGIEARRATLRETLVSEATYFYHPGRATLLGFGEDGMFDRR